MGKRRKGARYEISGRLENGPNYLLDATKNNRDLIAVNGCTGSAEQKKFGTHSLRCNGGVPDVYAVLTHFDELAFEGDFCIDGWFYFEDVSGRNMWSHGESYGVDSLDLYVTDGELWFEVYDASVPVVTLSSGLGSIVTGQWYHVMVRRRGSTWELGFGTEGTGDIVASQVYGGALPVVDDDFYIGQDSDATATLAHQGWIDEFRISDVSRHGDDPSEYPVPSGPFQPDPNTLALYHFNR